MVSALVALLVAVLGLTAEAGGIRATHHWQYGRTLANIARLEVSLGIASPLATNTAPRRGRSLEATVARWEKVSARAQANYSASVSRTVRSAATPEELAKIRERSYKRWYDSQTRNRYD